MELGQQAQGLNDVVAAYNKMMQDQDLATLNVKASLANEKLQAQTTELESLAQQQLELAAIFNNSNAIITSLNKAVANQYQSSVIRDQRYQATFDNVTARFSDVTTAIATINEANTLRDVEFESFVADTIASFDEVSETFASQNQAFSTLQQTLTSKIETDTEAAKTEAISKAQEYTRTAVGYCLDAQGQITSENDAVQCVADGGSWVNGPLAEFIANMQISDGENSASIKELRQLFTTVDGKLVARGGWTLDNNGRVTGIAGYNDGEIASLDLVGDIIRQGAMVNNTFVPTSYVDNSDPLNPQHVIRGRLVLGDGHQVQTLDDIKAQDGEDGKDGINGQDGATGPQGIQGPKGADGLTTYTWLKYADNASGAGLSNSPTNKEYIGFAYNKTTATESTNPADYTWSKIKGEDGANGNDGVPGAKGADGQTTYTWIVYSDNANGSGMYQTPNSNTKYIGIAVNKTTATESTNPANYTWSLFKGADGQDGASSFTLNAVNANAVKTGNSVTKVAGSLGWDAGAQSVMKYKACVVSATLNDSRHTIFGLSNTANTSGGYEHINYALYGDQGSISIYESGTYIGFFGSYTSSDNLAVECDGEYVHYYKNGVVFYSSLTVPSGVYGFDCSIYQVGTELTNIAFTQLGLAGYTPIKGVDYFDGNDGSFVSFIYIAAQSVPAKPTGGSFNGTVEQIPQYWSDTPVYVAGYVTYVSKARYVSNGNAWINQGWSNPVPYIIKGTNGNNGTNGSRGAGRYTIGNTEGIWYNSLANSAVPSGTPVIDDIVTIYKLSDPTVETTKKYNGSTWVGYTLLVNGNALIKGSVEGDSFKAGTRIESPRVDMIGSATMKIEYMGGFGPDNLWYWYGPRILSDGLPNLNALTKANAIEWKDVSGNIYISGSITAGTLSTSKQTTDLSASAAVAIGPFGSNGGIITIKLSYSVFALSTEADNVCPINFTSNVSVALEKKNPSGTWSLVDTLTASASTLCDYESEHNQSYTTTSMFGSLTYTDNDMNTANREYRARILSRGTYHTQSNFTRQSISLISSED
ncbi:hypothetical protein PMAG_a0396 [Pseudoalteromonas mariniglutinosa NCIMB 1770]|nr:hypothetical protein [Pseudoalteromonas mariniglutinosa NCIMB 1770]